MSSGLRAGYLSWAKSCLTGPSVSGSLIISGYKKRELAEKMESGFHRCQDAEEAWLWSLPVGGGGGGGRGGGGLPTAGAGASAVGGVPGFDSSLSLSAQSPSVFLQRWALRFTRLSCPRGPVVVPLPGLQALLSAHARQLSLLWAFRAHNLAVSGPGSNPPVSFQGPCDRSRSVLQDSSRAHQDSILWKLFSLFISPSHVPPQKG